MPGRDRCRPDCACTSRTRLAGVRLDTDSGDDRLHGGSGNDLNDGSSGNELQHPVQKQIAMPLQLRNYGS
jgi:hypothetical protein